MSATRASHSTTPMASDGSPGLLMAN
jgi:hypothetical protein